MSKLDPTTVKLVEEVIRLSKGITALTKGVTRALEEWLEAKK